MDVISSFAARYERTREEELTLEEYLAECKRNRLAYATAAERMLEAIGAPQTIDTRSDPRLSRLFANKVIKLYPAFAEFYGMEDAIEQVVSYFRHAAQGLEEKKQILYLLGPGRRRQELDRRAAQAAHGAGAVLRHQGLAGERVAARPVRRRRGRRHPREGIRHPAALPQPHPVAVGGQAARGVRRRHPQVQGREALSVDPAPDRHLQDRAGRREQPGHLVAGRQGRHPEARDLSRRTTPTPTATRAACAWPTRACSSSSRCSRRRSRCCIRCSPPPRKATSRAPRASARSRSTASCWRTATRASGRRFATTRTTRPSSTASTSSRCPTACASARRSRSTRSWCATRRCADAACAPGTLKMMSQFAVLTRLKEPENSSRSFSKMQVYDGENLKDTDPQRQELCQEYRDYAGVDEGMSGISTRFAFKIISKVFNFDSTEVAANPVHLMYVLEQQIEREQFPAETEQKYLAFIKEQLAARYAEFIGKEIQTAYLESYSRVRPEHLRPLRDLRRLLDPGPGVPRHRHRRGVRPRLAERRTREDREARRHRQSEGLPQRDRQLRAARARRQPGQEPGVDQLREAAHGDREEDVLEHRGAAAGHQLQRQEPAPTS